MGLIILPPGRQINWKPPIGATIDPNHRLAQGLLAAYLMNENGGGFLINSAHPEMGPATLSGTTPPLWGVANFGFGLTSFLGVSGHTWVDCGAAGQTSLGATQGPITVAAWVRPTISTGTHGIMSHGGSQWYLRLNALKVEWLKSQVASLLTGTTACNLNNWNHVAVTEDAAGNIKTYVNGIPDATGSTATVFAANAVDMTIGSDNGAGTDVWQGDFDSVYMWQRVLLPKEIMELYVDPFAFMAGAKRIRTLKPAAGAASAFQPTLTRRHPVIGVGVY